MPSAVNVNPPSPSHAAATSRSNSQRSVLRWVAIIAALAFAGFLAMFSFDEPVLSIDFVMHNIPSMIVLIGAALAWHRAWVGAAWLAAASIAALIWFPPLREHLDWFAAINLPPMVIALMLTIDGLRSRR